MEKRSEVKKQAKTSKKEKLKFSVAVLFCIMVFMVSIYTVDNSINKLLLDESDKHAIYMNIDENNLKVELVGEKFDINIKHIKNGIASADKQVKLYFDKLKIYIYSKI